MLGYSQANIDSLEIFFDSDPGYGEGFIVQRNGVTLDTLISLGSDTLATGFHQIGVRVRSDFLKSEQGQTGDPIAFTTDQQYRWSLTEYRSFYVSEGTATVIENLVAAEYWFDDDPGPGNGSPLSISAAATIDISPILQSDTLSDGFHTVGIRVQDANGVWSLPEYRSFIVGNSGVTATAQIDSLEYWFDDDPGVGAGIKIDAVNADSISISTELASDTLSDGFHVVGIRAKDENGAWSIPEYRSFIVSKTASVSVAPIDYLEYWFDNDPGVGNGTALDIGSADTIQILQALASDTLSAGFHQIGVRTRDVNGNYSLPEYRAFIVGSTSAASVTAITSFEYFFDNDPGYGNGIDLPFNPGDSITLFTELASDTLSSGFHVVGIRAINADGVWSPTEFRSFIVGSTNLLAVSPITKIEYFYDDDPGFGLGTTIPVSNLDSVLLNVNIPPPALPGLHTLTVRAQDADGNWSIGEVKSVYSLDPGRELDSLALVELYNANDGAAWTNRGGWLTGNLDTWYGVSTAATRVDSLNLKGNGLAGVLPDIFAYITAMRVMDLSDNLLTDSIPFEIPTYMNSLEFVDVSYNNLNGLPDLSNIATLQTLNVEGNNFDFGDLEPNASIPSIFYAPQDPITVAYDSTVDIGQLMSLDLLMGGFSNNYQWYKDSLPITNANAGSYIIPSITADDSGRYYNQINNDLLPGLILTTDTYHLVFSSRTTDSLALVSLYNSTGGANWINQTNWLTGPIDTWFGVGVLNGNVIDVNLDANNLEGIIPGNIYHLDSLTSLSLNNNTLSGFLPGDITRMSLLTTVLLGNNQLDSIPNLNASPRLSILDINGNKIDFEDIEVNLGLSLIYSPMDSIGDNEYFVKEATTNFTIDSDVRGANNIYQWLKDGTPLAGETGSSISINNIQFANEGFYVAEVTNGIVPGLTMYSKAKEFRVASLMRDSIALVNLYESTNGNAWNDQSGWDESNRSDLTNWTGVVIANSRITGLDLSNQNLEGDVSDRLRDITQLETLDLSSNSINRIPFFGTMELLTSVDVSNNQIPFEYLEVNKDVPGFVYNPQDPLQVNKGDTIYVGESYKFTSGTYSKNNSYAWALNDNVIASATDSSYTIGAISRDSVGLYKAIITNSVLTDLTLETAPASILAKASVSGTVTQSNGNPLDAGEMMIFKITESAGFDTTNFATLGPGGTYTMTDVLLDDYILVADPDVDVYPEELPTYFGNTVFWVEADTIPLVADTNQVDIKTFAVPPATNGPGSIFGIVVENLDAGGKVSADRIVIRASVSVTRVSGGNRTLETKEDSLVAQLKTDNNGQFVFPKLDIGLYRINVEYPGIPMAVGTQSEIEVKEDSEFLNNEVKATVTLEGIIIERIDNTVGLADGYVSNLNIYPNPSTDRISIALRTPDHVPRQLSIVDMMGREMFNEPLEFIDAIDIDVSQFETGTYILRAFNETSKPIDIARIIITR